MSRWRSARSRSSRIGPCARYSPRPTMRWPGPRAGVPLRSSWPSRQPDLDGRGASLGEGAWRENLLAALDQRRAQLVRFPVIDTSLQPIHLECPLRLQLETDGRFETAAYWLPLALRTRLTAAIDELAVRLAIEQIATSDQATVRQPVAGIAARQRLRGAPARRAGGAAGAGAPPVARGPRERGGRAVRAGAGAVAPAATARRALRARACRAAPEPGRTAVRGRTRLRQARRGGDPRHRQRRSRAPVSCAGWC